MELDELVEIGESLSKDVLVRDEIRNAYDGVYFDRREPMYTVGKAVIGGWHEYWGDDFYMPREMTLLYHTTECPPYAEVWVDLLWNCKVIERYP